MSATPPSSAPATFEPLVCVVDFHHARGPEIEHWIGCPEGVDPTDANEWQLIPYMALPDGAHQNEEEFSYFTLVYKAAPAAHHDASEATAISEDVEPTSVFGISCCRQIAVDELLYKSEDVTRSAVQKAVVAITDRPQSFSALREKLRVVTRAWFAQRDFRELEILQRFQEALARGRTVEREDERHQYFGLSLRELLREFKWQTLVLFKCLLLQPKMLFFGSHCERVSQVQFTLISLIPGLTKNLRDCADSHMNRYAETHHQPDSVRTSDRSSLLAYMGLPLQLFGKGSVFGPYTPLQQLDTLTDLDTKSYVVGSTNSLLIQQKDRYCDILIDLDDNTVNISSATLRSALALTSADRRFIDFLTQAVNDTWDESDPSRPKTHGYAGSEEFIRMQFEEYLLGLLSATKYRQYFEKHKDSDSKALLPDVDGDPSLDFSQIFIDNWTRTENYALWNRTTDSHLFDISPPAHPCAGGLTIEDVQRRLAQQVAELHLDERFSQTRDVVGRRLADGRTQVTSAFNKVWADIEVMREAQRRRAEEAKANPHFPTTSPISSDATALPVVGQKAGAYFSSWSSWAAEKRKTAWRSSVAAPPQADHRLRAFELGKDDASRDKDFGNSTSRRRGESEGGQRGSTPATAPATPERTSDRRESGA